MFSKKIQHYARKYNVTASSELDDLGKIHVVSISSDIHEDSYEQGEGKHVAGVGLHNERIGKTFNSAKEMCKWLASHYGLSEKPMDYSLDEDNEAIQTDRMVADHSDKQNGGWMEPTDEETALWKKGKMTLYNEHYFIAILTKHHFAG